MRVHAALTPADASGLVLDGWAAIVIDVLRATTTVIAACAAGCRRVIPVADIAGARACAGALPPGEVLLAGERGGEPVEGFALGNSPLEFTPERVRGRTIVLTTTNGTAAMLTAAAAGVGAVAALTNVGAASAWAAAQGRDVAVLCAGDDGAFSLEDTVCAGLIVSRLAAAPGVQVSDGAAAALGLGEYYAARLGDLHDASRWARRLTRAGRGLDVEACLKCDTTDLVPIIRDGGIAPGAPGVTAARETSR
jgi:2-phosphosulfolactate phosphatase